jgi:hypothetical protein
MIRPANINLLNAWNRTPMMLRVSILARSLLEGEHGSEAVAKLIALAAVMASSLTLEQRITIAHQMRNEADQLDDRKALH